MSHASENAALYGSPSAEADSGDAASSSKAQWSLLATISDLGLVCIDVTGGLVELDTIAARHHRVDPMRPRRLAIDAWLALFSEADQLCIHMLVRSELRSDRTDCVIARLRWSAEGEPPTLELSLRADPASGDVLVVCRDVTTAHGLEEMRRHRIAGERASRAKSEFMSQVSHELRTPLNSILGFAQLMAMDAEQPLPARQRERLEKLQHSSSRLLSLVDQLLQIGKIEQGKLSLRPRSVNLHSLVRRCVDALAPTAGQSCIRVDVAVDSAQGATAHADPDAVEQVLVNLLSNGIKYNRQGGKLTIRCDVGDDVQVTVDDTGHGLSPSQIAHLFEPFNRLDAARTGIPGAGLGLVICRKLVEAMHGALQVWSEVGVGSRFRVTLPRARSVPAEACETLPIDIPSQWATGDLFRVLYVEDDEVNVVLMDQVFATQPDWTLSIATTGAAGLMEAIRQSPDFILLDLGLPDMTGWEVRKRLKLDRRTRDIPVIAVSADAMPANRRRARVSGFEDYWTKPLDLPATIEKLKALCNLVRER